MVRFQGLKTRVCFTRRILTLGSKICTATANHPHLTSHQIRDLSFVEYNVDRIERSPDLAQNNRKWTVVLYSLISFILEDRQDVSKFTDKKFY